MPDTSVDTIRAALVAEARSRFGEARAEALRAELEALAIDLARVADTPLPAETEPGFFLLDPAGPDPAG
jgi:hypothetical protein